MRAAPDRARSGNGPPPVTFRPSSQASVHAMETTYVLRDCPECRGVRTVVQDVCYVCFAEFGEREWHAEDDLAHAG